MAISSPALTGRQARSYLAKGALRTWKVKGASPTFLLVREQERLLLGHTTKSPSLRSHKWASPLFLERTKSSFVEKGQVQNCGPLSIKALHHLGLGVLKILKRFFPNIIWRLSIYFHTSSPNKSFIIDPCLQRLCKKDPIYHILENAQRALSLLFLNVKMHRWLQARTSAMVS